MQIWPAIDLRGGHCVRLTQGDYDRETIFGDDPAAMARHWVGQGAKRLHVVDLEGARDGALANLASIRAIVGAVDVPCQVGGGVRDESVIEQLLACGVDRMVVGTKALKEPEWFRATCRKYPGKLCLGIDARDGFVATDGWREASQTPATSLAREFAGEPLAAVIYTDIATDGMLNGPNFAGVEEMLAAVTVPLIASGGVTTQRDVERLAASGAAGCIMGRALYEGRITLADVLRYEEVSGT